MQRVLHPKEATAPQVWHGDLVDQCNSKLKIMSHTPCRMTTYPSENALEYTLENSEYIEHWGCGYRPRQHFTMTHTSLGSKEQHENTTNTRVRVSSNMHILMSMKLVWKALRATRGMIAYKKTRGRRLARLRECKQHTAVGKRKRAKNAVLCVQVSAQ